MKGLLIRNLLVTAAAVFSSACGTPPTERPKVHGQHDRALLAAVRANNVEEVRSLLALGADPDSTESADGLDGRWTALLLASSGGHSEIAEALVRAGADVNRRPGGGFDGYTPLHLAAGGGHVELAKILLEHGANVNARFGLEGTQPHPLYSPCMTGNAALASLLLAYGAEIDRRDLQTAIENGHVEVVQRLLGAGADPRWVLPNGRTVMDEARRSPKDTRAKMIAAIEGKPGMDSR